MRLVALSLAALFAGCSGSSTLTAADLSGTTWVEVCPDGNPERSYIRLDPGGSFAWSYAGPEDVSTDSGEAWAVDGDALTVSWNEGYASSTYDLSALDGGRIPGTTSKSCGDAIYLERVP